MCSFNSISPWTRRLDAGKKTGVVVWYSSKDAGCLDVAVESQDAPALDFFSRQFARCFCALLGPQLAAVLSLHSCH